MKVLGRVEIVDQGNYLGKKRKNYYISGRADGLIHKLSLEYGLPHSGIVELAVRQFYMTTYGSVPEIPLLTRRFEK